MYGHERSLVESFSGRPFVLLGVNTDQDEKRVQKAIAENNLNWRSWMDGSTRGPICSEFKVSAFPTIMLIDHEGVIRYHTGEDQHRGIRRPEVLDTILEDMVAAAEADGMRGGAEPGPQYREFVDITGKHRIQAAYTGFADGRVILTKEDDENEIKVPWKRLSYDDRQYVALARIKSSGMKKPKSETGFDFEEPFEFTDTNGKSFVGTFIALNKGKAIVWKQDGTQVEVPWRRLSDASKEFIQDELKRLKY